MDRWDSGGSSVEVAAALPIATLNYAIGELDFAALANGPVAATRTAACFEDRAFETRFAQFVGRDKARDSSAQDDDSLSFAEIGRKLRQRRRTGSGGEPEGSHRR